MATFSELYGERLTRELGSADTTSLFTTARRKDAVNQAQTEFAKQTECFQKTVSIPVSDGTREYDLETLIAADDYVSLAADGVEYVYTDAAGNVTYVSGDEFPRLDLDVLNRERVGWRAASNAQFPDGYYLREDGGTIYLGLTQPPTVTSGDTAALTVPYVAIPPTMVSDTDEPFSDSAGTNPKRAVRPWHQGLVHYAAALLEPLRKGFTAEQRQRQLFAGLVADYLQRHRKKGGSQILHAHDYRRAARRHPAQGRSADPRVWP